MTRGQGMDAQALERQSGPDLLPRAVHLLFDDLRGSFNAKEMPPPAGGSYPYDLPFSTGLGY